MSKTLAKRWKAAEKRADELEREVRYLRGNRLRYAEGLRRAEGELHTLRAALAVLAGKNECFVEVNKTSPMPNDGLRVERKALLEADGGLLRCCLEDNGEALRIWLEKP